MLLTSLAVMVLLLGVAAWVVVRRLDAMPSKAKKKLLKRKLNAVFVTAEERGWIPRSPAFDRDYHSRFPALARLEAGYPAVREECLALLDHKERLTDISALGGSYTQGRHPHDPVEDLRLQIGRLHRRELRALPAHGGPAAPDPGPLHRLLLGARSAPGDRAALGLLQGHPPLSPRRGDPVQQRRQALLAAGQRRPQDNAAERDKKNRQRDTSSIVKGEVYHWHDGEGIVFDDNYLHDAGNDSDQVRVVLWLDLKRPAAAPARSLQPRGGLDREPRRVGPEDPTERDRPRLSAAGRGSALREWQDPRGQCHCGRGPPLPS